MTKGIPTVVLVILDIVLLLTIFWNVMYRREINRLEIEKLQAENALLDVKVSREFNSAAMHMIKTVYTTDFESRCYCPYCGKLIFLARDRKEVKEKGKS